MTNAIKAGVIAAINAGLGLIVSFGVNISSVQQAAIITFVNAGLALWILISYKASPKRIPDA